jgi:hypothetical protein
MTWEKKSNDLQRGIYGVANLGSILFAGTNGGGVYANASLLTFIGEVEKEDFSVLRVRPNPAGDDIWIDLPADAKVRQLEIFDALGRLVQVGSNDGTTRIDLHPLPAGTYFIRIRVDRNIYTGQFVKN